MRAEAGAKVCSYARAAFCVLRKERTHASRRRDARRAPLRVRAFLSLGRSVQRARRASEVRRAALRGARHARVGAGACGGDSVARRDLLSGRGNGEARRRELEKARSRVGVWRGTHARRPAGGRCSSPPVRRVITRVVVGRRARLRRFERSWIDVRRRRRHRVEVWVGECPLRSWALRQGQQLAGSIRTDARTAARVAAGFLGSNRRFARPLAGTRVRCSRPAVGRSWSPLGQPIRRRATHRSKRRRLWNSPSRTGHDAHKNGASPASRARTLGAEKPGASSAPVPPSLRLLAIQPVRGRRPRFPPPPRNIAHARAGVFYPALPLPQGFAPRPRGLNSFSRVRARGRSPAECRATPWRCVDEPRTRPASQKPRKLARGPGGGRVDFARHGPFAVAPRLCVRLSVGGGSRAAHRSPIQMPIRTRRWLSRPPFDIAFEDTARRGARDTLRQPSSLSPNPPASANRHNTSLPPRALAQRRQRKPTPHTGAREAPGGEHSRERRGRPLARGGSPFSRLRREDPPARGLYVTRPPAVMRREEGPGGRPAPLLGQGQRRASAHVFPVSRRGHTTRPVYVTRGRALLRSPARAGGVRLHPRPPRRGLGEAQGVAARRALPECVAGPHTVDVLCTCVEGGKRARGCAAAAASVSVARRRASPNFWIDRALPHARLYVCRPLWACFTGSVAMTNLA